LQVSLTFFGDDMRTYTNKLIELAEEGVITWEQLARECLAYMSETEAEDVAKSTFELE